MNAKNKIKNQKKLKKYKAKKTLKFKNGQKNTIKYIIFVV
jgi:hypothetical protein